VSKVHCGSALGPGASRLLPLVGVPDVLGGPTASCVPALKPKNQKSNGSTGICSVSTYHPNVFPVLTVSNHPQSKRRRRHLTGRGYQCQRRQGGKASIKVWGPQHHGNRRGDYGSGELDSCELGVFRSHCFLLFLLRLNTLEIYKKRAINTTIPHFGLCHRSQGDSIVRTC